MSKLLLLALATALAVTGCMGFPLITVHTLVPPSSFSLGAQVVAYAGDRDRVEFRSYPGALRQLYFVVEDQDIDLYDFVVVYADGKRERYDARLVFRDGARSRYFALHEGSREIQSIEFRYRGHGRWADQHARILVYGVR